MADRALRLPEMEGDWTLVLVDQNRRKVLKVAAIDITTVLVIFVPDSDGFESASQGGNATALGVSVRRIASYFYLYPIFLF